MSTHVSLIPLSEGGRIDLDDGTFDEGVGTDQLVVGRIVDLRSVSAFDAYTEMQTHDTDDAGLPGGVL